MAIVLFPIPPECRTYFIIACIVHSITVISLVLRIVVRVVKKTKVGWDDFLVALSAVFTSGMVGVYGVAIRYGYGHPLRETLVNFEFLAKCYLATVILFICGSIMARLGALVFYHRVFAERTVQRATEIIMVVSTSLTVAFFVWGISKCRPTSALWDLKTQGKCGKYVPPYPAAGILFICTDLIMLFLPMPLIWRLHITRNKKLWLTCLFSLGLIVIGIVAWRIAVVNGHGLGDTRPVVTLTGILESDLIVICTSFPIIYPWLSSIVSARWNQNPDRSRSQSWTLRAIRTIGGAISKRGERAFDRLSSPDTVGGTYPLHSIHTTREWTVTERTLPEGQQPSNTDFGVSMDARTESNAAGEHRNWI